MDARVARPGLICTLFYDTEVACGNKREAIRLSLPLPFCDTMHSRAAAHLSRAQARTTPPAREEHRPGTAPGASGASVHQAQQTSAGPQTGGLCLLLVSNNLLPIPYPVGRRESRDERTLACNGQSSRKHPRLSLQRPRADTRAVPIVSSQRWQRPAVQQPPTSPLKTTQ